MKPTPCYFIQTGVGNIVMRLRTPDTGAGAALTLHQIVALGVPIATISHFDPNTFKKFYGSTNMARCVAYNRIGDHREEEDNFLKYGPGINV